MISQENSDNNGFMTNLFKYPNINPAQQTVLDQVGNNLDKQLVPQYQDNLPKTMTMTVSSSSDDEME